MSEVFVERQSSLDLPGASQPGIIREMKKANAPINILPEADERQAGYYPPDDGYPDPDLLAAAQARVFAEYPALAKAAFAVRAFDLIRRPLR